MSICGPAQEMSAYRPPVLAALPATCWWETGKQNRVDTTSFKGKTSSPADDVGWRPVNSLLHPHKNVTVCDLGFGHCHFQLLLLSVVSLMIILETVWGP